MFTFTCFCAIIFSLEKIMGNENKKYLKDFWFWILILFSISLLAPTILVIVYLAKGFPITLLEAFSLGAIILVSLISGYAAFQRKKSLEKPQISKNISTENLRNLILKDVLFWISWACGIAFLIVAIAMLIISFTSTDSIYLVLTFVFLFCALGSIYASLKRHQVLLKKSQKKE